MSILKVARMGHPVLREKARALSKSEISSDKIKRLIADMYETMQEYSGLGLAAPQVHESVQLALIEFDEDNARYPDIGDQPLMVLINPTIKILDEKEQGFWEGCLSVPDLRGLVFRPRKIQVDFLNEKGEEKTIVAEDFLATVFQHELDHLDGVLYVDKVKDMTKFSFIEEYQRYHTPESLESEGDDAEYEELPE